MQEVLDFIESTIGVRTTTLELTGLACLGAFALYHVFKLFEDDPAPAIEPNAGTQPHVDAPPSAAAPTLRIEKSARRRAQQFCLVCGRELAEGVAHGH